ncbi:MAG TPA: glycosyltransferase family 2 protein [Polyangiaceae bacterium]|nr:glycosyltransferase family 2 protein [Polyangiaceae bacterium]
MGRPELSLIIPIYNEELVIPELHRRLGEVMADLGQVVRSWEVVFIDDGSKDKSLSMLREISAVERRYKVLSFSRNFGHQLAITAGIDRAEGDAVVIIDADLQDPPEVIKQMIAKWREGFDVVYGVRRTRAGETLFKKATAAAFYRILRVMLGGLPIPVDAGDFRLVGRPVVLTLRSLKEKHRFVRGMVTWVGFKQFALLYDREARFAGETKYPFSKMLRFAIDAITSFSIIPLRFATWLGVLSGLVAGVFALFVLYAKLFLNDTVQGWTTIMIAVALGSSAQLIMIGVLGEYIGRIYEEIKRRPLYVTAEQINFEDGNSRPNEVGS